LKFGKDLYLIAFADRILFDATNTEQPDPSEASGWHWRGGCRCTGLF